MKVEKEWRKYPEYLTRMTGTLCDGDYFAYTITTSKSTNSDSSVAWKELKSSIATTSPAYRCPENNSPSHEPDKRRASGTSENRKRSGKMLDVTSSHKVRRMAEGRFKLTLSAVLTDNVSYVRIAGCSLFRVMPQTSAPYSDRLSGYATVTSMQ